LGAKSFRQRRLLFIHRHFPQFTLATITWLRPCLFAW
jgi:hypothetical protein